MKLILCPKCSDVVKFGKRRKRHCRCKKSWGKYTGELHGEYGGEAIPIGFANGSLIDAIKGIPDDAVWGKSFEAFVIPKNSRTCKKAK